MEVIKNSSKYSFCSNRVEIAEDNDEFSDVLKLKFIICDFSINRNGTRLNRDTIENWIGTIVNKPVVGLIKKSGYTSNGVQYDFSTHNLREEIVYDESGSKHSVVHLDNPAYGAFTSAQIEEIDGHEYITANAVIWKRFEKACEIIERRIKDGKGLNSSWEVDILDSDVEVAGGQKIKTINDGVFTAHCLLSASTLSAYECSKVLEVAQAQAQDDDELQNVFMEDAVNIASASVDENKEQEDKEKMAKEKKDPEKEPVSPVAEPKKEDSACGGGDDTKKKDESACDPEKKKEDAGCGDGDEKKKEDSACGDKEKEKEKAEAVEEPAKESASLTEHDIEKKLSNLVNAKCDGCIYYTFPEEHIVWVKNWREDELTYTAYSYSVNGEDVVLGEGKQGKLVMSIPQMDAKITELNSAIASANETIKSQEAEIAKLKPYKEKDERAQAEAHEKEVSEKKQALQSTVERSKLFTEKEISEAGSIHDMIESLDENGIKAAIAERYIDSLDSKKTEKKVEVSEVAKPTEKVSLDGAFDNDISEIDAKAARKLIFG